MNATETAPRLEREGTHALLTTGLSVLLGFALSIIVSRTLGPEGKGLLDLTSATIALFTLVLGGSLNAALTHVCARSATLPQGLVVQTALWAAAAGAVTWAVLGFRPDVAMRTGLLPVAEGRFWVGFVVVCVGFGVWSASLRGMVIARGGLIAANRIDLLVKAGLLVSYLALLSSQPTPAAFALAGAGAAIVLAALLLTAVRNPTARETGVWPALLATLVPLHGTNILHFLNQRMDIFFVQAWHGSHEVGLYALAVSLAQIVLLASSGLAQPLLPRISRAASPAEAAAGAAHACRLYIALSLLASAAIALGACWLVPLLFGRDFSGSLPALLTLLPGMIGFGLTNLLIAYFVGTGRHTTNLWISLAVLGVTLAGNFWLTRQLGAIGAAITSAAAYALAGGLSLFCFARATQTSCLIALRPTGADWHDALTVGRRFRL